MLYSDNIEIMPFAKLAKVINILNCARLVIAVNKIFTIAIPIAK